MKKFLFSVFYFFGCTTRDGTEALRLGAGEIVSLLSESHFETCFNFITSIRDICRTQSNEFPPYWLRCLAFFEHLSVDRDELSRIILVFADFFPEFPKPVVTALGPPMYQCILRWILCRPQELLDMYTDAGIPFGKGPVGEVDSNRNGGGGLVGIPRARQMFAGVFQWLQTHKGPRRQVSLYPLLALLFLCCPLELAEAELQDKNNKGSTAIASSEPSEFLQFRDALLGGLSQRGLKLDITVTTMCVLYKVCSFLRMQSFAGNDTLQHIRKDQDPFRSVRLLLPVILRNLLLKTMEPMENKLLRKHYTNMSPELRELLKLSVYPQPSQLLITEDKFQLTEFRLPQKSLMAEFLLALLILRPSRDAITDVLEICCEETSSVQHKLFLLEVLVALTKSRSPLLEPLNVENALTMRVTTPVQRLFIRVCNYQDGTKLEERDMMDMLHEMPHSSEAQVWALLQLFQEVPSLVTLNSRPRDMFTSLAICLSWKSGKNPSRVRKTALQVLLRLHSSSNVLLWGKLPMLAFWLCSAFLLKKLRYCLDQLTKTGEVALFTCSYCLCFGSSSWQLRHTWTV